MARSREAYKRRQKKQQRYGAGHAEVVAAESPAGKRDAVRPRQPMVVWSSTSMAVMVIAMGIIEIPAGLAWGLVAHLNPLDAILPLPWIPVLIGAILAMFVTNQMVRPAPGIRFIDAIAVGCVTTVAITILQMGALDGAGKLFGTHAPSMLEVYSIFGVSVLLSYLVTYLVVPGMYRLLARSQGAASGAKK